MATSLRASRVLLGTSRLHGSRVSSTIINRRFFSLNLSSPSALLAAPAIEWNIPGLIQDIWESILRAVPKKKTSHRKKRQRFLVGKALKDNTNLNSCPGCGHVKKAHTLCPYCVHEIKEMWIEKAKKQAEAKRVQSQS